ncbi:MAG: hypothetical protein E5X69_29215, partial [Mesorhizobium sp.]
MAGLYSVSTSLTAASNGLPQGLLSSNLATSFRHDGQAPEKLKNNGHDGKMARLKLPAPDGVAHEKVVVVASAAGAADRFDSVVKRAALSPQKLADAVARAENAPF